MSKTTNRPHLNPTQNTQTGEVPVPQSLTDHPHILTYGRSYRGVQHQPESPVQPVVGGLGWLDWGRIALVRRTDDGAWFG